jgi:hypothetical protein
MRTSKRVAERPLASLSPTPAGKLAPTPSMPMASLEERSNGRAARKSRHVILFLAANPINTNRLAFDRECAAIEHELRLTEGRDVFDFRSKWAVTADEMMRHLNELHPAIIHFSGHGRSANTDRPSTTPRDIACGYNRDNGGLYLQDEHGNPQLVTARALKMMIKAAAASTRVVVLNACFSSFQATALRSVVDCVIGMTGAIRDDAARSFAIGFYRAIGNRRSIGNAVEQAIAILAAKQLPDARYPRCRTRKGVDASQIVLGDTSISRRRSSSR